MFTKLKVQYADGKKVNLDTEPMRRLLARSLMLQVFYSDPEIVSARFFMQGKGKPPYHLSTGAIRALQEGWDGFRECMVCVRPASRS